MSEPRDEGQPGNGGEPQGSTPAGGSPSQSSSQYDGGSRNSDPWSSATREDAPPPVNGQARANGQPGGRSQPGGGQSGSGQPGSGRGSPRGGDPVTDFQRWLMKAGARSMANQVADQVKRTIGTERKASGDVWDTATTEPPPTEAPECQWCPICQAARAARTGGATGFSARLADAAGGLAGVVEGAFSVFEQAMKAQEQNRAQNKDRQAERPGFTRPGNGAADRGEAGQ